MRRATDACPVGTRGARRSRASQVASIGCPVRARGGAEAQRRGLSCFLPLVGVVFRSRRRRRDRGDGLYASQVVFTRRCVAAGTVDDAERRPHVVGVRCGRLRSAWAGCPLAKIKNLGCAAALRHRGAARRCPTVLKVKRGASGRA